jgi:hypothetical protein
MTLDESHQPPPAETPQVIICRKCGYQIDGHVNIIEGEFVVNRRIVTKMVFCPRCHVSNSAERTQDVHYGPLRTALLFAVIVIIGVSLLFLFSLSTHEF